MYGPVEADFRRRIEDQYSELRRKSLALHSEACNYMPGGDTRTAIILIRFLTILKR